MIVMSGRILLLLEILIFCLALAGLVVCSQYRARFKEANVDKSYEVIYEEVEDGIPLSTTTELKIIIVPSLVE